MDVRAFRRVLVLRFLRAAGVVVVATPGLAGCAGEEACFRWDSGDSCPARSEALQHMVVCDEDGCIASIDSDGVLDGGDCCYEVTIEDYEDECGFNGCAVEGRPLRIDGHIRAASAIRSPGPRHEREMGWANASIRPDVSGLSDEARSLLAEAYVHSGLMEHASVACFSKFALELMSVGAPSSLVADAQRAALDEIAHAELCFGLASAYAGERIEPTEIEMRALSIDSDLASIAAATVREGCIGETLASVEARTAADRATDPIVRQALLQIAEDEARHAELAWRVVAWAIARGGERVRSAVRSAFDRGASGSPVEADTGIGVDSLGLEIRASVADHGRLDSATASRAHADALREIVRPCARALLGATDGRSAEASASPA